MSTTPTIRPELIVRFMRARKLTADDVAYEIRRRSNGSIRTTARGVSGWMRGESSPRSGVVPLLAQTLGVSIDSLYGSASDDDEEAALLPSLDDLLRRRISEMLREAQEDVA